MKIRQKIKENWFLFQELSKRDFKKRYKRSVLGVGWSILSPLLTLLVMRLVFTNFFGRSIPNYTTYLFAGNVFFGYFREATKSGMKAITANRAILSKINVSKYVFLMSQNVSAFTTFLLTLVVFFFFALIDRCAVSWTWLLIVYPIFTITLFNIGVGMILSSMFIFFSDIEYLYNILVTLLSYLSAIFYRVDSFAPQYQNLFFLNPIYCNIYYVRYAVIDGKVPGLGLHLLLLGYSLLVLLLGYRTYKKHDKTFFYYL